VIAVVISVLLIKGIFDTQHSREAVRMACLVPLITLPVFNKQAQKNKGILLASVIGSFIIPFLIFMIWSMIN
jgi:hypothetical protein